MLVPRALLARRAFASASAAAGAAPKAVAGRLFMWGTGEFGKLGLGDASIDVEIPTPVPALVGVPIVQVSCGKQHTLALAASGDVWAWGVDSYGQLGIGAPSSKPRAPTRVAALRGGGGGGDGGGSGGDGGGPDGVAGVDGGIVRVVQVSAGDFHSAAVTACGRLFTWGYGGSFLGGPGGLGHGSMRSVARPTAVGGFGPATGRTVIDVSCGGYHTIARTAEGEVFSWGRGEWGRLGHGSAGGYTRPERLEQLLPQHMPRSVAASAASAASAFATADAAAAASDASGGGSGGAKGPAIVAVTACEAHSAALDSEGRVWTWGHNDKWQLGYELTGFLNSGQTFDAQLEPAIVRIAPFEAIAATATATATAAAQPPAAHTAPQPNAPAPAAAAAAAAAGVGDEPPPAARARGALRVAALAASDSGGVAVAQGGREVAVWGFRTHFEPQLLLGVAAALDAPVSTSNRIAWCGHNQPPHCVIVTAAAGESHALFLTASGTVCTWGLGAPLGVAQAERLQWTVAKNALLSAEGRVLAVSAGPMSSAAIIE
ncbi:hypothetical protein KFE25_004411 [Diacronema lutheri]|uniref:Uncharacterized protein n=1 Tax=Diacronema lutheri TaxID=2081491 RepID=A0A8J6BZH0_DIALT|nr:hypothetical protein KFE25_004411 [Diacronema lutheri]